MLSYMVTRSAKQEMFFLSRLPSKRINFVAPSAFRAYKRNRFRLDIKPDGVSFETKTFCWSSLLKLALTSYTIRHSEVPGTNGCEEVPCQTVLHNYTGKDFCTRAKSQGHVHDLTASTCDVPACRRCEKFCSAPDRTRWWRNTGTAGCHSLSKTNQHPGTIQRSVSRHPRATVSACSQQRQLQRSRRHLATFHLSLEVRYYYAGGQVLPTTVLGGGVHMRWLYWQHK